ncbi:Lrp/AsnC family transcriptional regulator [Pseudonocardia xinjiangensis]|jgi:DNA-binding Lrp family transcriptional regulator|uniref:Lrp/AsnC family transcriptional regulator n=1 Tax=Pseudonocardia xinjiangensis TaxID=75289 RepID=A0ABX1RPA6_9PSEU|nr:Lrp/AsnC family transcriptional regulator [Pseudonocardia xinjiangensis]NMH82215.1 Lrp/AsnC family transcriptional regulator [Pseudonocardia xinjiangensis]
MDATNREIIRILLADGRASFQAIGRQVNLSAPAVKRRVDQMVARGEIAGFTAVIDPSALGWNTEAYVELYYDGNVLKSELETNLSTIPQVVGVWSVTGDADALVHVMAGSMAELEDVIELIRSNAKMNRTRSAVVLSRLFQRPRL